MEKMSDSMLKRIYRGLSDEMKKFIFPSGELEFLFVAKELLQSFPNEGFEAMLKRYASTKVFFNIQMGNCYRVLSYAVADQRRGSLSDEQVIDLVALVHNTSLRLDQHRQPILSLSQSKEFVVLAINQFLMTDEHEDFFQTKDNDQVGTKDNPLLLAGVRGVDDYFKALRTLDGEAVMYRRDRALHHHLEAYDMQYSLDVYELTAASTGRSLGEVWVNIYGMNNCELCPPGYRLVGEGQ